MYGIELGIIVFSTLAQSLSGPSWAVTMTGLLIFWRVMMGIGIGGDYPLSAVITSEYVISILPRVRVEGFFVFRPLFHRFTRVPEIYG